MIAHRRAPGRPLAARARDGERGSVLIMVAISLLVIVTATALTVDLGRISTLRRDLQNVADATALDLVRLVDGRTAGQITLDGRWASTRSASLTRNGFVPGGDKTVNVQLGAYNATTEVFTPVASAAVVPSAVQVVVTDRVRYQFAPGGATTSRRAVAANRASAGIQVGSFAARLDSSQSALLSALVGDALGVSLVGYEGLAGVEVGLAPLATELGLTVASPDELLSTELSIGELIAAQAAILRRGGDLVNANLLEGIVAQLPNPNMPITLGELIDIATGGASAAAVASLDVLELITAAAFAANGESFLEVPGLSIGVPGVVVANTSVRVIQAPQWAFGGVGTRVDTAQVELDTSLTLDAAGLVGVTLGVSLDVAAASAVVTDISCGTPRTLGVDVTTGLARVAADVRGQIAVSLLGLLNITVADVTAQAEAGNPGSPGRLEFALPPDALGQSKQYSSDGLSLSDLDLQTDVALLPTTQLPVLLRAVLGLVESTAEGVATAVLEPLLATTLAALDTTVVQPLLRLLGVSLPGADVTPLALRCAGADLVA